MSGHDLNGDGVWQGLFLTAAEKDRFAEWREVVLDRSVVGKLVDPLLSYAATWVPDTVAPNVLTVGGSFFIVQAWYFCENYSAHDPSLVSWIGSASLVIFWILGGIDGKHAQRTMNDTSMGELFKYVCDLIGSVFLVVVMCSLLLEHDLDTQWYCVQSLQLVLLMKHYSAFMREAGLRYFLVGPGECVCWAAGLLAMRALVGLDLFQLVYVATWGFVCDTAVRYMQLDQAAYLATMSPARAAYLSVLWLALFRIVCRRVLCGPSKHLHTRMMLSLVLCLRAASAYLRLDVLASQTSKRDVIFDGLFMAMVTSDLIVAKMSQRELHPYVILMASMVVMPHLQFLILSFLVFYYLAVFADLMYHQNLPLLVVCRNVYCDGVYDLCHVGHKNAFREALKLGNRLFVGVVGDTDANNYKRPPVMTAAEREAEVASCKCVTKVIPNAPCFGMPEEFIRKHRIHRVAFGQEYIDRFPNPDDDPYYKVPRKMGIAYPMPRTEGMSTSDLIRRIQARGEDKKKSPT